MQIRGKTMESCVILYEICDDIPVHFVPSNTLRDAESDVGSSLWGMILSY